MTIEQRLIKDCGLTDNPYFGVWMLKDGSLINGSLGGHQRDLDHREISGYYKPSKFEDPGSAGIYILKFMRRGNIRWSCSEFGFCIELIKTPTARQFRKICQYMDMAIQSGIETRIGRMKTIYTGSFMPFPRYKDHVLRYHPEYMSL